jgi:hypothetical protein
MRLTALSCVPLLLLGSFAAAPAADIAGKWTAETHMGGGGAESPVETIFTFKTSGDKLTGTVSSERGVFEIEDGKIDGESITFTLVVPGAKILYDGEIREEGIDFLAEFEGRGRTDHFIAKRLPG